MKMKTKTITVTAVMIALCIVVQLFKNPMIPYLTYITGGLINLILIIDTLYCGFPSGVLLSIITPITAFIITASPIMAAVPAIIPCIMIGNVVIVFFAWLVRGRKTELNLMPISLVAGSFAKYGIMTLLIVKWVLPGFGSALAPRLYHSAAVIYSTTQLIAALAGTALACIIWPIVRLGIKKRR